MAPGDTGPCLMGSAGLMTNPEPPLTLWSPVLPSLGCTQGLALLLSCVQAGPLPIPSGDAAYWHWALGCQSAPVQGSQVLNASRSPF